MRNGRPPGRPAGSVNHAWNQFDELVDPPERLVERALKFPDHETAMKAARAAAASQPVFKVRRLNESTFIVEMVHPVTGVALEVI